MSELIRRDEVATLTQAASTLREIDARIQSLESAEMFSEGLKALDLARQYARIYTKSAETRRAAIVVEARALRRIGELGLEDQVSELNQTERQAARGFAGLPVQKFEEILLAASESMGAGSLWTQFRNARAAEARELAKARFAKELGSHRPMLGQARTAPSELAGSARGFLEMVSKDSDVVSLSDVADDFADVLARVAPPQPNAETALLSDAAYRKAARAAVDEAANLDSAYGKRVPVWLSFFDKARGWVKVHWTGASLADFRFVVALREAKLAELQASVLESRRLLRELEGFSESDSDALKDLLSRHATTVFKETA